MGVDLESIKSKPVRALIGCFQLRRPTVCVSYAEGKTWSVFSAYQSFFISLYLLMMIYLSMYYRVSSIFDYIFTFAESSVVLCGR